MLLKSTRVACKCAKSYNEYIFPAGYVNFRKVDIHSYFIGIYRICMYVSTRARDSCFIYRFTRVLFYFIFFFPTVQCSENRTDFSRRRRSKIEDEKKNTTQIACFFLYTYRVYNHRPPQTRYMERFISLPNVQGIPSFKRQNSGNKNSRFVE